MLYILNCYLVVLLVNIIYNLNSSDLAPICIFVYNRPEHTAKMIKGLIANTLFEQSMVYVFVDGPKDNATSEDLNKITEVKNNLNKLSRYKNVNYIFSKINKGLTKSITEGITDIIDRYNKVIVIEDDIELSPFFLQYMNEALSIYEDEEKVMHIGGYMVPNKYKLPSTFFLGTPTIWGWGTWKRAWDKIEIDARTLLSSLEKKYGPDFAFELDVKGTYNYSKQLKDIASGKLDTWDIQWAASIYLNEGLCLHPNVSLTRNNGFDGSGVHCHPSKIYEKQKIASVINVTKVRTEVNELANKSLQEFFEAKNVKTTSEKINELYYGVSGAIPPQIKSKIKGYMKILKK